MSRNLFVLGSAVVALSIFASVAFGSAAAAEAPPESSGALDEIDRIIVIVEQDHTYDSYFGSYSSPASEGDAPDRSGSATPGLFALADNYVLFDNYFASSAGGTLGNMLDLMTGDDHGLLNSSKESLSALSTLEVPTLFDRLNAATVSWRLYVGGLASFDSAKILDGSYVESNASVPASAYRVPILSMQRTWQDRALTSNIVAQEQFFADADSGSLPAVSFVFPAPSDHPGQGGSAGEARLLSLVNAVQKSSQWDRTAIFVTWDDGGGQFDSAVPAVGAGLRVPLLLVSPYAKRAFISHTPHDHLSLLGLIESHFGLQPLPGRPNPSSLFDDGFDVAAGARTPQIVSRGALPPTPVGTSQQNRQTILLYLGGFAAAALFGATGWLRLRSRAT